MADAHAYHLIPPEEDSCNDEIRSPCLIVLEILKDYTEIIQITGKSFRKYEFGTEIKESPDWNNLIQKDFKIFAKK